MDNIDRKILNEIQSAFPIISRPYLELGKRLGLPEEEVLERVVGLINGYKGVTHNYLRGHDYNVWFTLIAPSTEDIEDVLNEISEKTGVKGILNLPAIRTFKIKVDLQF